MKMKSLLSILAALVACSAFGVTVEENESIVYFQTNIYSFDDSYTTPLHERITALTGTLSTNGGTMHGNIDMDGYAITNAHTLHAAFAILCGDSISADSISAEEATFTTLTMAGIIDMDEYAITNAGPIHADSITSANGLTVTGAASFNDDVVFYASPDYQWNDTSNLNTMNSSNVVTKHITVRSAVFATDNIGMNDNSITSSWDVANGIYFEDQYIRMDDYQGDTYKVSEKIWTADNAGYIGFTNQTISFRTGLYNVVKASESVTINQEAKPVMYFGTGTNRALWVTGTNLYFYASGVVGQVNLTFP